MNDSNAKRRTRWQRWGWGRRLLAGATVLLLSAVVAAALFYFFTVRPSRQSAPYRQAVERIRENRSAQRLLGRPVRTGWWVRGHTSADSARLSVPVRGSRSSGTLRIEAERDRGRWAFSRLELEANEANLRVDLLQRQGRRPQRREEDGAAPLDVPPRYLE